MAFSKMLPVTSFMVGVVGLSLLLLCGASNSSFAQVGTQQVAQSKQTEQAASLPDISPFVSPYRAYLYETNQNGVNGLHKVATADFALRDDYANKTFRGEKAFVEAQKIYDGMKNNVAHLMRFQVAKQMDQYAIVYAEETVSTIENAKDASGIKTPSKVTVTWRWKHTWRKVGQTWKLASLARDDRPKEERQVGTGKIVTVRIQPGDDPYAVK